MQVNGQRLLSVIGKTPYNTFSSVLTLQQLFQGTQDEITKVVLIGDDKVISRSKFDSSYKKLLEKKTGVPVEVVEIPSLNDLYSSRKSLDLELQKGDIIDLRPGSSIHCALLIAQSQMYTRIGQSPITLCVPSARGDRIHFAKIGVDGFEAGRTFPNPGIGDLEAFIDSIKREDEYITKHKVKRKQLDIEIIEKIDSLGHVEGEDSEKMKKIMSEIIDKQTKKQINTDLDNNPRAGDVEVAKWGFCYEAVAELIISSLLNNLDNSLQEDNSVECWMNIEFRDEPRRKYNVLREEDIIFRIGCNIVVISMKFNSQTNRNAISTKLNSESNRLSDLFGGVVPVENMHRFIVTPTPRGASRGHSRVAEIKLSQLEEKLLEIVNHTFHR